MAKNTLARFAAERTGRTSIVADLVGPTAIAFGTDPVATAKALQDYTRVNRTFVLKSALLGDRRIDPKEVEQLASLPPADQLRGKVFGMIVSPLQQTVSVLPRRWPVWRACSTHDARNLKKQGRRSRRRRWRHGNC